MHHLCGRPAEQRIGGVWLCDMHITWMNEWRRHVNDNEQRQAGQEVAEHARMAAMKQDWDDQRRQHTYATTWRANGASIVYYMRRESDGLIKIGVTTKLQTRIKSLRVSHGPLRVLLTHRGDRARERMMHDQFADLRVTGEWFRPGEELLAMILETRHRKINQTTLLPETVPIEEVEALVAAAIKEAA